MKQACSEMNQLSKKFRKYLFQINGENTDKSIKDVGKIN